MDKNKKGSTSQQKTRTLAHDKIVKNHFFSFLNFRLCQKSAGNFKGNFYFYLIGV